MRVQRQTTAAAARAHGDAQKKRAPRRRSRASQSRARGWRSWRAQRPSPPSAPGLCIPCRQGRARCPLARRPPVLRRCDGCSGAAGERCRRCCCWRPLPHWSERNIAASLLLARWLLCLCVAKSYKVDLLCECHSLLLDVCLAWCVIGCLLCDSDTHEMRAVCSQMRLWCTPKCMHAEQGSKCNNTPKKHRTQGLNAESHKGKLCINWLINTQPQLCACCVGVGRAGDREGRANGGVWRRRRVVAKRRTKKNKANNNKNAGT